ncbi:MAG: hypothetical protein IKS28_01785 [Clostridia bacterium]|nr:hypothetical protein [Clostridia bacterium]
MPEYDKCVKCGNTVSADDIGLYRKLVDRTADGGFMCIRCMAERFGCNVEKLEEKVRFYRENGCLLFP